MPPKVKSVPAPPQGPVNVHLLPVQNCPEPDQNGPMGINRISFLSIGDLAEELVALGQALNTGKATPGAHRTLQDAASALTTLSAEARNYEAALRSALSALSHNTEELRRATTVLTRSIVRATSAAAGPALYSPQSRRKDRPARGPVNITRMPRSGRRSGGRQKCRPRSFCMTRRCCRVTYLLWLVRPLSLC